MSDSLMTNLTREIIDNLKQQPSWIIHDVQTFQWIRFKNPKTFEKENLGGGNILSIIGLFSVINYYSKVYKILQSGKLPKEGCNDKRKNVFVEEQAFKRLASDYKERIVNPTQDDPSLTSVWKIFRNALSHMAQIYPGNQALVLFNNTNISQEELRKSIANSQDAPFTQVGNGFICFVDKFISYTEGLRDWIISNMDKGFKQENIKIANTWIKQNTHIKA